MAQYKKQSVKNQILEAGLELFLEKGYENTQVKEIAGKIEISVGNVYRYFESKFEIYRAIIDDEFLTSLKEMLKKRSYVLARAQFGKQEEGDKEWLINKYYPFFIKTQKKCLLLHSYYKGTDFEKAINLMADIIIENKKVAFKEYDGQNLSNIFTEVARMIVLSNVELYVKVFEKKCSDEQKIKLLKMLDVYHISGLNHIYKGEIK